MRHPRDMGVQDVEAVVSMMANGLKVSAFTHNQALSAVLFFYRMCATLIESRSGKLR